MKRKSGKKVACEICGKFVFERGLKSHIRLAHNLKIKETTEVVKTPAQVKDRGTTVISETYKVVKEYTPNGPTTVNCYKCRKPISVDIAQQWLIKISTDIVCDNCLTWYKLPEILYQIRYPRFDKSGVRLTDLFK